MANSPNPQVIREVMYDDFGTRSLITNPESDIYLKRAEKHKKQKSQEESDLFKRWCGGKNGFNVWAERLEDS